MRQGPRVVRRDEAALVVIDVQDRLASTMARRDEVVEASVRLIRAASLFGWPVLVTRQYPAGLGDLEEELLDALASPEGRGASVIDKTAFCCLAEDAFADALDGTGRAQVVLAGMETHICVAQTALALAAAGRETFVAADACCSRSVLDNDVALARMRGEGVVVTTSQAVMYEAAGVAATDEFRALLRIVKD